SISPISPMYAAAILATIGHIANFEDAGHLKSYFGWAPKRAQTGVSFDRTSLTKGGSREMKKVMYLVAWHAIKDGTEWASLYKRLVPRLCTYDERYVIRNRPSFPFHGYRIRTFHDITPDSIIDGTFSTVNGISRLFVPLA